MLPKEDRKAMLLRLYNEVIPLQDGSKARFEKKEEVAPNGDVQNTSSDVDDEDGGVKLENGKTDDVAYGRDDLQAIMDATSDEGENVMENTVDPGLGAQEVVMEDQLETSK